MVTSALKTPSDGGDRLRGLLFDAHCLLIAPARPAIASLMPPADNAMPASRLEVPPNIILRLLPPYSPELNPQENLWEEIREKTFNLQELRPQIHG
jgi:hypothetical protein